MMNSNSEATESSHRLLLVALSGIGNLLMQAPTMAAIKAAYPQWHVTVWVAPRGTAELAKALPYIDEVLEAPIKVNLRQHFGLLYQLSRHKFQTGIILSPGQLVKGAAYLFLAGIPERVGHTYPWLRTPHNHFLLTKWIDEQPETHDIEQNLALLPLLGISQPTELVQYSLSIPATAQIAAQQLLENLTIPSEKYLVGLHPGSAPNFRWKRWPLPYFTQLAQRLIQERKAHILLFGGPDEQDLVQQLKDQLGVNSTIIQANLLTVASVIQHCDVFISNDSGLMHLAAAVGVPTYGLFGPTDETLTGPRGPQSWALRAPGTKPVYTTEKAQEFGTTSHTTLQELTPEFVLSQLPLKEIPPARTA